jgi:hypothetical protein
MLHQPAIHTHPDPCAECTHTAVDLGMTNGESKSLLLTNKGQQYSQTQSPSASQRRRCCTSRAACRTKPTGPKLCTTCTRDKWISGSMQSKNGLKAREGRQQATSALTQTRGPTHRRACFGGPGACCANSQQLCTENPLCRRDNPQCTSTPTSCFGPAAAETPPRQ